MLANELQRAVPGSGRGKSPYPVIEHPNDEGLLQFPFMHLWFGFAPLPWARPRHTGWHDLWARVHRHRGRGGFVGSESQRSGDHVLVPFNIFCGSCFFCKARLDCYLS